jgi:hypothetical protein
VEKGKTPSSPLFIGVSGIKNSVDFDENSWGLHWDKKILSTALVKNPHIIP